MLNECEIEYDTLIGFIQDSNLENELNQYLYAKIKDCDDKEQLEAFLRLITNEQEDDLQQKNYI
ncbi:hypothetical protein [Paenibacillus silvae]|uniref:Uncharacterized protein n=1 Tax=Paenibacillus silvae TaxID=1325358 RepID=A0A2W6NED9_9BACL|nr:hypothetical protein [Paenibacillus silvae]PZT54357.1 hypothetical protein DN757_17665 [Paenibacillus silvae]